MIRHGRLIRIVSFLYSHGRHALLPTLVPTFHLEEKLPRKLFIGENIGGGRGQLYPPMPFGSGVQFSCFPVGFSSLVFFPALKMVSNCNLDLSLNKMFSAHVNTDATVFTIHWLLLAGFLGWGWGGTITPSSYSPPYTMFSSLLRHSTCAQCPSFCNTPQKDGALSAER